jgi:hypothetical protein
MQCADVTELLLAEEVNQGGRSPAVDQHLLTCESCAHVAAGLDRLNAVLQPALVTEPPLALQQQLAELVATAPLPSQPAWWQRLLRGELRLGEVRLLRPNMIAAQGLAAIMLSLAGWQIFGWLSTFQPVVGDVGYAMQLVATSPAQTYLGGLQIDLQSLGIWSIVGLAAWLVSEGGPVGRRLPGLRLP